MKKDKLFLLAGSSILAFFTGLYAYFLLKPKNKGLKNNHEINEIKQCAGVTKGGSRCMREPEEGSIYCWQHQPY